MMTDTLIVLIKCFSAVLLAVLAGNGTVYFFNKMPAQWLCDYGETPSEELLDPYTQRIKSYPWKFIFTMLFAVLGIKMVMEDWQFYIAALCSLWLLLEMAVADVKYRIVPDQLIMLLSVSALGYLSYHGDWKDCLFGGLAGFGIMAFVAVLGKWAYKRDSLGGGDIKLFAALGLISGFSGILVIFILTTLLSAGHLVILLAARRKKRTDTVPMVPYIAVSAAVYIVFLWGFEQVLYL